MATEFKVPNLGENVDEGDIVRVMVKEGDQIDADQSVMEIETGKAVETKQQEEFLNALDVRDIALWWKETQPLLFELPKLPVPDVLTDEERMAIGESQLSEIGEFDVVVLDEHVTLPSVLPSEEPVLTPKEVPLAIAEEDFQSGDSYWTWIARKMDVRRLFR